MPEDKNWQFELEEYIKEADPEKPRKSKLGGLPLAYRL